MPTRRTKLEPDKRAREYIDKIAAINRRHGMGDRIPDDTYNRAVEQAARAFKNLRKQRSS